MAETPNQIIFSKPLQGSTEGAGSPMELVYYTDLGEGRIVIPVDSTYAVFMVIGAKESASGNSWRMTRQFVISNDNGTTTLEGSVNTVGTDGGSASLSTVACTITADDTLDCIKVEVTGVAATPLRYTAIAISSEVSYP